MPPRRGRGRGSIGRITAGQRRAREYRLSGAQAQSDVNFRSLQTQFEENMKKLKSVSCSNCSRTLITDKHFEIC